MTKQNNDINNPGATNPLLNSSEETKKQTESLLAKKAAKQTEFLSLLRSLCVFQMPEDKTITLDDFENYVNKALAGKMIDVSFCKEAYQQDQKNKKIHQKVMLCPDEYTPFLTVLRAIHSTIMSKKEVDDVLFGMDKEDTAEDIYLGMDKEDTAEDIYSRYFNKCIIVLKILGKHNFNPNILDYAARSPETIPGMATTAVKGTTVPSEGHQAKFGPPEEACIVALKAFIGMITQSCQYFDRIPAYDKFTKKVLGFLLKKGLNYRDKIYPGYHEMLDLQTVLKEILNPTSDANKNVLADQSISKEHLKDLIDIVEKHRSRCTGKAAKGTILTAFEIIRDIVGAKLGASTASTASAASAASVASVARGATQVAVASKAPGVKS